MRAIEQEIAEQPAAWREAARRAPSALQALPRPGQRVAVLGCGTSYYIAQAYAAAREQAGEGVTDAFVASETPTGRAYDLMLAISRSGTTTEVARCLAARVAGTRASAISARSSGAVLDQVDDVVVLEFADERSVVQTLFATSALALLRASLGVDLDPAAAEADKAVSAPLPLDPRAFEQFVFLGRGWTVGLASEAALKLREAGGAWSEAYPAMEYRHGPIALAGPRTAVWVLGEVDPELLADVARTGAHVVTNGIDALADLVLAQRVAVALGELRGLDPDHPRFLTRSVVLE